MGNNIKEYFAKKQGFTTKLKEYRNRERAQFLKEIAQDITYFDNCLEFSNKFLSYIEDLQR